MSILSPLKLFNADKAVCRTCGFKHKTSNAEDLLMHIFPKRKTYFTVDSCLRVKHNALLIPVLKISLNIYTSSLVLFMISTNVSNLERKDVHWRTWNIEIEIMLKHQPNFSLYI